MENHIVRGQPLEEILEVGAESGVRTWSIHHPAMSDNHYSTVWMSLHTWRLRKGYGPVGGEDSAECDRFGCCRVFYGPRARLKALHDKGPRR